MDRVSSQLMQELDKRTIEEFGVDEKVLMENAGLKVAEFLSEKFPDESFTFYAGKGNNGGDALVAARRLHSWNFEVEVVLAYEDLDGLRKEQLEILEKMDAEINVESSEKEYKIAVDGLLGYNIKGDPRPPLDEIIEEINTHEKVVSIDIGSGLDPDTGKRGNPCVSPDFTVTLAAPFEGLNKSNSGEIFVADIGFPSKVYRDHGLDPELFAENSLIRFRP